MKFIFSIVALFSTTISFAQGPSGCIVYDYSSNVPPYSGKVFTQIIGTVPTTTSTSSPFIAGDIRGTEMYNGGITTTGIGPNIPVSISCYRQPSNTLLRECAIRFQTANTTPAVYSYYGGLRAQNYYSCPIDDYIPYFLFISSIFGFTIIRKYPTSFLHIAQVLNL
ncbi:hypothetical protein ASE92_18235 [Pedobacter sp. Leaf41]|nr:hypothetical protein ASE92_18235 [Pedobacter sp. Leaf41]